MFDETPPPEVTTEPNLKLKDFLLAETPVNIFKYPAQLTSEMWRMVATEDVSDLKTRTLEEIFDSNEKGVQGFLDGIVNRFTQAEANSLRFQVDAGLIQVPTEEQKVKIAKATN